MKLKPSTAATLALLRRKPEGITSLTALDEIGSFRLGARVWELRAAGYVVTSEYVTTTSGKRISKYTLHEQPEQMAVGW